MSISSLNQALRDSVQNSSPNLSHAAGTSSLDEVLVSDLHASSFEDSATTSFLTMIDGPGNTFVSGICPVPRTSNCASAPAETGVRL